MAENEMRLHRCCFTGHRPEKLFLIDSEIIKELERAISKAVEDGFTTFISGMAILSFVYDSDKWLRNTFMQLVLQYGKTRKQPSPVIGSTAP